MGSENSKQIKQAQELVGEKLTTKNIKEFHKKWHELYPSGLANKDDFQKFASVFLPRAAKDTDLSYLFRAMDADKNGTIDFQEFIMYQASSNPTTVEEIVRIAFDMYDKDGDGTLSKPELIETMTNIYKSRGLKTDEDLKDSIRLRVHDLMRSVDVNDDGSVTKEELITALHRNKSLINVFKTN
jgi:Ca2+-binding EF-hand superfamily protein